MSCFIITKGFSQDCGNDLEVTGANTFAKAKEIIVANFDAE